MPTHGVTQTQPQLLWIGSAGVGAAASLIVTPSMNGIVGAGLAVLVTAVAVIDARTLRIPNSLNLCILALGLIRAAMVNSDAISDAIANATIRAALLALAFLALRIAYRYVRRREGVGLGDVKLAGAAGAWLGWSVMPITIEIAALAALATYALRQRALRRAWLSTSYLPFGLFFAPAIWVGWLIETKWLAFQ